MSDKPLRLCKIALNVINLVVFGLASVFCILGILYLSTFRYEYSFSVYSVRSLAISFVVIGAALLTAAVFGILTAKRRNPAFAGAYAFALSAILCACLAIAIWGIVVDAEKTIYHRVRSNMFQTLARYDERDPNK